MDDGRYHTLAHKSISIFVARESFHVFEKRDTVTLVTLVSNGTPLWSRTMSHKQADELKLKIGK